MSYHILHILSYGSYLKQEHDQLVYQNKKELVKKSIPIEDLKAIIIAAKGVSISDYLIANLLNHNVIILHCNDKFLPVGITAPLERTINKEAIFRQMQVDSHLHASLWQEVLYHKVFNHAQVVDYFKGKSQYLYNRCKNNTIDEAICARYYWRQYFSKLGYSKHKRQPYPTDDEINIKLNYGYTVLGSLCHRSIVVHGLSPLFGLHHKSRYGADPLVYDLVEPLRAFIEKVLYDFEKQEGGSIRDWARYCAESYKNIKVWHKKYTLKLVDAVDYYVMSVANCFIHNNIEDLWVPKLILNE